MSVHVCGCGILCILSSLKRLKHIWRWQTLIERHTFFMNQHKTFGVRFAMQSMFTLPQSVWYVCASAWRAFYGYDGSKATLCALCIHCTLAHTQLPWQCIFIWSAYLPLSAKNFHQLNSTQLNSIYNFIQNDRKIVLDRTWYEYDGGIACIGRSFVIMIPVAVVC